MDIRDYLLLPITLIDNYRSNMKETICIKYFYKCIITSAIIITIFSVICGKPQLSFYYVIGEFLLILYTLKSRPNEMHERAFTVLWKKYKAVDGDELKNKILNQSKNIKQNINSKITNMNNKYKSSYEDFSDDDDEIIDEDFDENLY